MGYYEEKLAAATLDELEQLAKDSTFEEKTRSFLSMMLGNPESSTALKLEYNDHNVWTCNCYAECILGQLKFQCISSSPDGTQTWRSKTQKWNIVLTMIHKKIQMVNPLSFHLVHHIIMQGMNGEGDVFTYTGNVDDLWNKTLRQLFVDKRKTQLANTRDKFGF